MSRFCLVLTAAAIALAGCGREEAQRIKLNNDLKMLGLAYLSCHDVNKKGPSDWQETQKFGVSPETQKNLESNGYTVVWGLTMAEATNGASNTIIAYPQNAATAGGLVLFLDGAVQKLTGPEVTEKLKPAPTSAP